MVKGYEERPEQVPTQMSLISRVPAGVPSETQYSLPCAGSKAMKINGFPGSCWGGIKSYVLAGPVKSVSLRVPAEVPFEVHSSRPRVGSLTMKNSRPSCTAASRIESSRAVGGRILTTGTVPAPVPSLFHKKTPVAAER